MEQYYMRKHAFPKNKRMPLTFVLDVSGSMLDGTREDHPLVHMNCLVKDILKQCLQNPKVVNVCDVSFLLFADEILLESGFQPISELDGSYFPPVSQRHRLCGEITWHEARVPGLPRRVLFPSFDVSKNDNGTNIGQAVLHAVMRIEERLKKLEKVGSYPAVLVLISDGSPSAENRTGYRTDKAAEQMAVEKLVEHSRSSTGKQDLIVPIVISLGFHPEWQEDPLKVYTNHFPVGYHQLNRPVDVDWLTPFLYRSFLNDTSFAEMYRQNEIEEVRKGSEYSRHS